MRRTRLAFAAACLLITAAAIADVPGAFTLTATPICSSGHPTVLLQWTTSGGAASYDIARDSLPFAQGLSSDTTSFEDSSNDVGSTHSYVVTAIDEEGSTKSNTVNASAPASVCTPPPAPPTLSGSASCDSVSTPKRPFVSLSWSASSGATSYDIVRGSEVIQTTTATAVNDFSVAAGGTYTYTVRATNSGGASESNAITVSVAADICGIAPGSFTISTAASCSGGAAKVTVSWSASAGAKSYVVERDGAAISQSLPAPAQSFDDTNPPTDSPLAYSVRAANDSGTTESNTSTITVPAGLCGNVVPSTPELSASLFCGANSIPAVRLSWTPSKGATSYVVVRDGTPLTQIADGQAVSYEDTTVAAGQTYTYQLRAGNPGASATSNTVTISVTSSICAPLSADNVTLNATTAKPGDSIVVNFMIANSGSKASSAFNVAIRIGTTVVALVNIPSIDAGSNQPFTQTITVPLLVSGTYFVSVSAIELQGPALSPGLVVVGVPPRRRSVAH
jgi:fibronectin type 3 domain-containing protein